MALNQVTLVGRVPFENELKGNEGNEYLMFSLSVARDYKPEGEQYYPEDLITCKAFKGTAKFIAGNFPKGSYLTVVGQIRRDDDYEKDGQQVKGQMYVLVEKAYFAPKATGDVTTGAATQSKAPTPAAKAATTPASKVNPLAGGAKKPAKKPF